MTAFSLIRRKTARGCFEWVISKLHFHILGNFEMDIIEGRNYNDK